MPRTPIDPLRVQAAYYALTGVWPIVHLGSFYAVTGPKREGWLVQTFGALVTATSFVLWPRRIGGARRTQEQLAQATALTLAACDALFVARGRISPIYLADAALELVLAAAVTRHRVAGS